MSTTTLTSKYQMTLPKEVRLSLGVKPGDKIDIVKQDDLYVLKPRTRSVMSLAGILGKPPANRGLTVEEMDEKLGEALAEDDARIRAGR
jgi:antitoxin PrlF